MGGYHYLEPKNGELRVTCWCERAVVRVRVEMIRAARTRSCGLPSCYPGCRPHAA